MNKFDTMFKQEQNKIAIEKDLAQQQIDAKAKVIIDFCEENQIFDFLDYLNNKFIVNKTTNHTIFSGFFKQSSRIGID